MPNNQNYGILMQTIKDGIARSVVAIDGNPYTVNVVKMIDKMGIGNSGQSINPTDFELAGKIDDGAVTYVAPTVSSIEVFSNDYWQFTEAGSVTIREKAIYADTIDAGLTHHQVMIRRDLETPPFITAPATPYKLMYKSDVSLLT